MALMSDEAYAAWRATVPWTDDYMRAKHRRAADWVRAGHLSSRLLGMALPFLVKTCAVCGRKALYRIGNLGRCSKHRDVKDRGLQAHVAETDRRAVASERDQDRWDAGLRLRQAHHRATGRRRGAFSR